MMQPSTAHEAPRRQRWWSWRGRARRFGRPGARRVTWPLQMAGALALGTLVALLVALAVLNAAT